MKIKRILSFLIIFIILSVSSVSGFDNGGIKALLDKSASYLLNTVKAPVLSQTGGEWTVLALSRSDANVPEGYFENYYNEVEKTVKEKKGTLSTVKYTEYSRVVIALTAIGKDAANVGGYNLITPLEDYESTVWQGLNGAAYALIALDCYGYDNKELKNKYIDYILSRQLADGGFALSAKDTVSEADMTGIVIQALSKHTDRADVKTTVDKALNYLATSQQTDGGYSSWGVQTSESVTQVITALCELGINPLDERFIKNGVSLLDALESYAMADGGFAHEKGKKITDLMATEQCAYALVGYMRFCEGKKSLYDMSDVTKSAENTDSENKKDTVVNIKAVTMPGRTFDDIKGHFNAEAIEALAEREIINGKSEHVFDPDNTMTRAEFATIVVKALGLELSDKDVFEDVAENSWYRDYVNTAFANGIVNGISETEFVPNNTITKEMAAVMLVRAAKLCGNNTEVSDDETRNVLAQFTDYLAASDWAKPSLAYCYRTGILPDEDMEINHHSLVKRCEIAQMIYNMLKYSELI